MTRTPSSNTRSSPWSQVLSIAATIGAATAQVGAGYCTPTANSTGWAATIAGAGSPFVSANDLVLRSSNLPQHAAAFFLCSQTQSFVPNPGGCAGNLCLGGSIGRLVAGYEYRLPTEAEWEYACRAGTTTEYHYGPNLFCSDARIERSGPMNCGIPGVTAVVGSYVANALGLQDMHGNVSEWCLDSYAPYTAAAVTDPFVTGGTNRVHRGGSWTSLSYGCRAAWRSSGSLRAASSSIGLRVVLAPIVVP